MLHRALLCLLAIVVSVASATGPDRSSPFDVLRAASKMEVLAAHSFQIDDFQIFAFVWIGFALAAFYALYTIGFGMNIQRDHLLYTQFAPPSLDNRRR